MPRGNRGSCVPVGDGIAMDAGLGGGVGQGGAIGQGVDDLELLGIQMKHSDNFRLHDSGRAGKNGVGGIRRLALRHWDERVNKYFGNL